MRKLTLTLSTGITAIALGAAGIAYANHHGSAKSADLDGNGEVTLAEAKTKAQERFNAMDANKDGQISRDDRAAKAAERFAANDADGNGEISPAEMTAAHEAREAKRATMQEKRQTQMFERLDADNSGGLSQAEMMAAREGRMGGERGGDRAEMRRGGERGGDQHRGGRHGGKRGGHAMAMLHQADTNNDRIITQAEFDTAVEARFAKVDTDGSGAISTQEREAARAAMRAEHKERRGQRGEVRGASQ